MSASKEDSHTQAPRPDGGPDAAGSAGPDAERRSSSKPEATRGARSGPEEKRLQGHWLLARMGKRVLRPGGIELTRRVIDSAEPTSRDRIVEFGPGVGRTAEILLAVGPEQYTGVDPNVEGASQLAEVLKGHERARLHSADAKNTGLLDGCADLVVGEAMLTMQSDEDKLAIMREAFRILAPGGRYAIHELGFCPDDVPEEVVVEVSRSLSRTIKVGARPLTSAGWQSLLRKAGFEISYADTNPMALLEAKRLVADEGLRGAARFAWNVARNKAARERIRAMRSVFRKHRENVTAVGIVARKPAA